MYLTVNGEIGNCLRCGDNAERHSLHYKNCVCSAGFSDSINPACEATGTGNTGPCTCVAINSAVQESPIGQPADSAGANANCDTDRCSALSCSDTRWPHGIHPCTVCAGCTDTSYACYPGSSSWSTRGCPECDESLCRDDCTSMLQNSVF